MKKLLNSLRSNWLNLSIGLLFTLSLTSITFIFYSTDPGQRDGLFFDIVDTVHKKSIDLRLLLRPKRAIDESIAIVAIDERSLKSEGRWPWSRAKMSFLLEELVKNGAESVALDVLFSEPENEDLQKILEGIPEASGGAYAKKIKNYKAEQVLRADADGKLAATIRRHPEKIIMSSSYENVTLPLRPYQLLCYNYAYETSPYYTLWEREGYDVTTEVVGIDAPPEAFSELTDPLVEFFDETFEKVIAKTEEDFCKQKSNEIGRALGENCLEDLPKKEQIFFARKAETEKRKYCARWLTSKDENFEDLKERWPDMQEAEEIYAALSFEGFQSGLKTQAGLSSPLFPGDFWIHSIEKIANETRYSGYLNTLPDADGVLRRFPLVVRSGEQNLPSLAFRSSILALGAEETRVRMGQSATNEEQLAVYNIDLLKNGEIRRSVPTDDQGRVYINYAGPGYTYPHVSLREIFDPENPNIAITQIIDGKKTENVLKPKSWLKGKKLFLGATAIGIYDLRVTPFDENFPGVEKHANVLDNIVNNDFLIFSPEEPLYVTLAVFLLGLILSLLISHLGALPGLAIMTATVGTLVYVDNIYLFGQGIVVAMIFPFATVIGVYFTMTIFKYFAEEKNKKELKGTFGKYVSPAIVEEILADPSNIELGGRKQNVTVFFSDVRGFTTISETLSPTELGDLLNEYLTPMTEIIFENKGTLDKYIGDAIMAFFGAPIAHSDHAKQACRTALQNVERLKILQDELKRRELPHIDIGIGLNTGDVSVGNMGSNIVRNYTIMGDAVNLGARLEGITKQYGAKIIISEYTEKELGNDFVTREVDCVKVKGKNEPVRIFELIAENKASAQMTEVLKHFKDGYRLYHEKKWNEAIAHFDKALKVKDDDLVSKLYIERSNDYIKNPPPTDWDGVFTMTTK